MTALEEKQGKNGLLNDVVDVLLRDTFESSAADEAQPRLPLDSIGENVIELMIPGEETVPTSLTLAVKFLSDSPVVLARLVVCSSTSFLCIVNQPWHTVNFTIVFSIDG